MRVQWTSAAEVDLFVSISAGRSSLRVSDLLALVHMVDQHRAATKASKPSRKAVGTSSKLRP
jgi:hypothetical protein